MFVKGVFGKQPGTARIPLQGFAPVGLVDSATVADGGAPWDGAP